jgi:glycosyltransferase involved in cell wall biosynthesis
VASVSVVVPVHDGEAYLERCLAAIALSIPPPVEIIVAADGCSDGSIAIAARAGARVVSLTGGPRGPAVARNRGAAAAAGDLVCFVDADVVVGPETIARLVEAVRGDAAVAAAFGSYDARPADDAIVSRYRNLLHHFVHQHARVEAQTFWAGCGVVRRSVLLAVGGFDEAYTRPSIEDIELGGRLRAAGHRVLLRADAQATHLKAWTFRAMIRTDIFDRAVPWTRLIVRKGHIPRDLNLDLTSRSSALAVWIALAAIPAALVVPRLWWLGVFSIAALLVLNRRLYGLFLRQGGAWFALCAASLHALYLLYSSAVFALVSIGGDKGIRG